VSQPGKQRKRQPELFLNRELSWLEFDGRVLEEAMDAENPLLERLKFATITASNLDEFVMVRVAALKQAVEDGDTKPDNAGLDPQSQLKQIAAKAHDIVDKLYATVTGEILPALAQRGIRIAQVDELDGEQRQALGSTFRSEVLPALTPLAIDASRPFPMLANLSLNLALRLAPAPDEEHMRLAMVQVPARLPRLVRLAGGEGSTYVWLEEMIRAALPDLFPGQEILESAAFRIARDAEMELDDEGGEDYVQALEEELRRRRRGRAVRLEVEAGTSDALLGMLTDRLEVEADDVYRIAGPLDVRALWALVELPGLADLRDPALKPAPLPEMEASEDLFEVLQAHDLLLHHPYEAFDPVIAFVVRAADDPDVLAIKQTLYRTSGDSPVVRALARAAEQGKQVTVLVELLARFDEQSNIRWARRLEEAGAHVIYGIRGYKTHAKICLVVRRGRRGIERYVHLGTGNYNDRTARLYTDFGLLTADRVIGADASAFFNALTGYSDPPRMEKLVMAPSQLREHCIDLVERERRRAEAGQPAEIRAKMNSLVDGELIRALYDASRAGVKIRLNVRGICCLRPGIKGASDNIEVVSIVDRFLEHSRIFYFHNGGDEEVYLASADWMPRNLDKRIELLFPIESPPHRRKVLDALDAMFQDNVKSRRLQPDGSYKRRRPAKGEEPFRAQLRLHAAARRTYERAIAAAAPSFEPLRPADEAP
jgi:polyphosphate kinase